MQLDLRSPLAGWCLALDAVPDVVFAGRTIGDGVAIDPTGDCLHAPCDAVVLSIHRAGHAVALRVAEGVELLIHLGIDTVALGGAAFEVLVAAGDAVRAGDPLIRFDLDRIVTGASAAITPVLVTSPATIERLAPDGPCAIGDPLLRLIPMAVDARNARTEPVRSREIVVRLSHGLHARPAARLAKALRDLDADVVLVHGQARASAASSVALLGLSIACRDVVRMEARGPDADAALDAAAVVLADDSEPVEPARTVVADTLLPGARRGIGAAPGLAIGPAAWLAEAIADLPGHGAGIAEERQRLEAAIASVAADLARPVAGTGAEIAAAHAALLDDPELRDEAAARVAGGAHAATAFRDATEARANQLRRSPDARIAERADDLVDLGRRVVSAALGEAVADVRYAPGTILLADALLPSHLLAPAARALGGIALRRGGATSHVAILAAGLGIPMVVALGTAVDDIAAGDEVAIDGDAGGVLPRLDAAQRRTVQQRIARRQAAEDAARAAGDRPTETRDGIRIAVHANLGSLADADAAMHEGAEGSGLLRTEFLFLDRAAPPDRVEQAGCYRAIAERLGSRPLTLRLLDVGGDKPADYLELPAEENPALGERGVRVLLARPALLDEQLAAILDANGAGTIRIMLPMVSDVAELVAVRDRTAALAAARGLAPPPIGVMIETPAAALIAGTLAAEADFLSIGSNDLTQYALAMDRGNPAVAVGADALHPAVLRLIDATCRGAARHGRPVGLCGGLAADPLAVAILIGLGVRALSVPPARVPAIKGAVAAIDAGDAARLASDALDARDAAAVRNLARRHLAANDGDLA